eukprot:TRINITY_DN5126_c0_g1_i1.p1 TRINITY_DN5126_c0_g1~~TRINITY_DN5126_c0_g1_i1.p1  ORF type:complete len:279 (-),score=70.31 TRINITY_DN5126_c0_g1_i1:42-857(-)
MTDKTHTFTLTLGDQAENHAGMQKIGQLAEEGFSVQQLESVKQELESQYGCDCELVYLNDFATVENGSDEINTDPAALLVVRNGIDLLLGENSADQMYIEQLHLPYDYKAYMRGKVVNKRARHNLCFADFDQEPDIENKKGTVVNFERVPVFARFRNMLPDLFGEMAQGLAAEANDYYDPSRCGIGFHGDTERKKVIAVRLGVSLPIQYQWYYRGQPFGDRAEKIINHGDFYVMSEKASGYDWQKQNIASLRHAAGAERFLVIKKRNRNKT